MTTITLKINEKPKKGKAFLEMARVFFEDSKEIEIIEEFESPYDLQFVEKILKASQEKGRAMLSADDLWKSIK